MSQEDTCIADLLTRCRTIALVGWSPKPDRPSHRVASFLMRQGYRVIPVNPGQRGQIALGEVVRASLSEIDEPVDMVDIFRRSEEAGKVVDEALAQFPDLVCIWMQLGVEDVEAGSRALLERGPHICVVTLGRKGSFYQTVEGGEHVPGFVVPTVDAIGCGDAFVAALLTSLISSGDWRAQLVPGRMRRLVRYANAAGALTAQQRGVIPALPTAAAIEAFLARCGE